MTKTNESKAPITKMFYWRSLSDLYVKEMTFLVFGLVWSLKPSSIKLLSARLFVRFVRFVQRKISA